MNSETALEITSAHLHQNRRTLLRWALVSLVLALAAALFSPTFQALFGFKFQPFEYFQLVSPALGAVLFFTAGVAIFRGAISEVKARRPANLALAALALLLLFAASSVFTVSQLAGLAEAESSAWAADLWWQLAAIVALVSVGRWLEVRSVQASFNSMPNLLALLPQDAELAVGNETKVVAASQLSVGDIITVRQNAAVPADGVVIQGRSSVDESMVTGVSSQTWKTEGDSVFAGSQNVGSAKRGKGALTVRVGAVGSDLLVSAIERFVEAAKTKQSRSQLRAANASVWLFYSTVGVALTTGTLWIVIGQQDLSFALQHLAAVLLVASPAALALSIPLVLTNTVTAAARGGLLIRHGFDRAFKASTVIFDKTGTLTTGKLRVENVVLSHGAIVENQDELLAIAAAVEVKSQHQISVAIREAARLKNLALPDCSNFESISGVGVLAQLGERRIAVGGPALLTQLGIQISYADLLAAAEANENGLTVSFVVVDSVLCGQIQLGDEIRESANDAVRMLAGRGIDVALVTGDATGVANFVAKQVGIEKVFAEVQPGRKLGIVKQIQAGGRRVAFVGDGIDDASSLAQADVGVALGAGENVAIESAGLVIVNHDPVSVANALLLSKRSKFKRTQNIIGSIAFNVIGVSLVAGALNPLGVAISPVVGSVLVSLATVIVAANGRLLRR